MSQQATASTPEARVQALGLDLAKAPKPVANYVPWTRTGNTVFVSGQIPIQDGELTHMGKVDADFDVEAAQAAARVCTLNGLSVLRDAAGGSLDNVKKIVKITVFVASSPGFTAIPSVANGASDLLVQVFGDAGRHARAAVGVAELPLGVPVEVEFIAEVA